MAQVYDDGNYRAQAPEPEYRRRIRPENFFSSQGSVIDAGDVAQPLVLNSVSNSLKDQLRVTAELGEKVPGIRRAAQPVASFLNRPGMVALDKAQSVVGPAVQFLTDANPSQDPNHNKYVDLGVNSVGAVADYNRMIPSPWTPFAWAFGGTAEGLQNASSAKTNASAASLYDPASKDDQMNMDVIDRIIMGSQSSWGRGSAWNMAPFNPYDRVSSVMNSEVSRLAKLIHTGSADDKYYADVGDQLTKLAELVRLAGEEEEDRANPFQLFGGGEFAWLQAKANFGSDGTMTREQKDAQTIELLKRASQIRAENKARETENYKALDGPLRAYRAPGY